MLLPIYDTPDRPFSIHGFCREIDFLGHEVGKWLKPSVLANVLKGVLQPFRIPCVIAQDGLISSKEVRIALRDGVPVLVLVPLMLGRHTVEKKYIPFIQLVVSLSEQALGIVGGQQRKAFFLVGYRGDKVFYFDPHTIMDAILTATARRRLFEPAINKMQAAELSSSMLAGFFIKEMKDLQDIPDTVKPLVECPMQIVDELPSEISIITTNADGEWTILGKVPSEISIIPTNADADGELTIVDTV